MPFCIKCGKSLEIGSVFCSQCGTPTGQQHHQYNQGNYQYQQQYQQPYQQQNQYRYAPSAPMYPPTLVSFTKKLKIEGIIWIVIASIQAFYVLCYFGLLLLMSGELEDGGLITVPLGMLTAGLSALNFYNGFKDLTNSTRYLKTPVGILVNYKPIGLFLLTLIYNILFGGLLGIGSSIYTFYVRSIVTGNEAEFLSFENECLSQNNM